MSDASVTPPGAAGAGPEGDVEEAEPMSLGRRTARILAVVVAIGIAGLWAYALWGPTEKTFPGTLADPAFATRAQGICAETAGQLAALQPAYETRDAGARADIVDQANQDLSSMLDRLDAAAPSADSGNDGRMIQAWLGDWRTYLGDRQRYVVALQEDPGARLYVSEKDGRQITEPIDFFAGRANDMPDCVTPGDLA